MEGPAASVAKMAWLVSLLLDSQAHAMPGAETDATSYLLFSAVAMGANPLSVPMGGGQGRGGRGGAGAGAGGVDPDVGGDWGSSAMWDLPVEAIQVSLRACSQPSCPCTRDSGLLLKGGWVPALAPASTAAACEIGLFKVSKHNEPH